MHPGRGPGRGRRRPIILRVGTDQDLQVLNPWHSVTVADYEIFQLNYDLLVELRPEPRARPRLRRLVVELGRRQMTHTFHIRDRA